MPKLVCPCGFVHNLSPIPDDGWVTVRDKDYESLIDSERVRYEISGTSLPGNDHPRVREYDDASRRILSFTGLLYECPRCGTVLWRKAGSKEFRAFKPADPTSEG